MGSSCELSATSIELPEYWAVPQALHQDKTADEILDNLASYCELITNSGY